MLLKWKNLRTLTLIVLSCNVFAFNCISPLSCIVQIYVRFSPAIHQLSQECCLPTSTKQRDSSEHKVKGFADDLTIINISKQVHKWTRSEVDTKCSDLDLHIRPDKCVSLSFDGSKLDKSFIVPLQDGNTRNISDIGARFLGSILMGTPRSTNSSSSNTLITTFRASLQALDARPIRGEYKLWIYQHYLAPSTHFYLAVNPTSANAIKKTEACATKALKK